MRRTAIAAALAAALLAVAGPATANVVVGIGDEDPGTLADPRLVGLGVATARVVLPWDVAWTDPSRLGRWVTAADDAGIEPLIAFGHSRGDRCPASPCTLPSDQQYVAAFESVRARNPEVRLFTPWNEPNHSSEPTAGHPAAAAHYADLIAAACPECSVVAGDLLDAPGMADYLAAYKAALSTTPAVWSLHNYYDTAYFGSSGTDAFLAAVDGPVWITETGGIVTWRTADGTTMMPYDEERAAASVQWALDLAAARADRVARIYVYQWRAGTTDDFDAGLLRADGSERPGYYVLQRALTAAGGTRAPESGAVLPTADAPAGPRPHVRLGGLRLDRHGSVHLRLACAVARCLGAVSLEGRGWAAEHFVNGRIAAGSLAPHRRAFSLAPGGRTDVVIRLSRSVALRAARRLLAVRVTLVPADPADGWARRVSARLRTPRR